MDGGDEIHVRHHTEVRTRRVSLRDRIDVGQVVPGVDGLLRGVHTPRMTVMRTTHDEDQTTSATATIRGRRRAERAAGSHDELPPSSPHDRTPAALAQLGHL
jgi:hypothetical protein